MIQHIQSSTLIFYFSLFYFKLKEKYQIKRKISIQKSHTCEEGGAHLRISFWHLLINLNSNYLLKKLLKWANKKQQF